MTSKHSKKILLLLPFSLLFSLVQCAIKKHDDILPPNLPSIFSAVPQEKSRLPFDATALAKWWTKLADPVLSELVEQGLLANYDIAIALARIDQARAMSSAAGAEQMPTLSVERTVNASRASLKDPALGRAASALGFERNTTTFKVGPTIAWEIDLFGRKKALREEAEAKQLSTEADAQAIRLLVASEIAKGVVRLRSILNPEFVPRRIKNGVDINKVTIKVTDMSAIRVRFEVIHAFESERVTEPYIAQSTASPPTRVLPCWRNL